MKATLINTEELTDCDFAKKNEPDLIDIRLQKAGIFFVGLLAGVIISIISFTK